MSGRDHSCDESCVFQSVEPVRDSETVFPNDSPAQRIQLLNATHALNIQRLHKTRKAYPPSLQAETALVQPP